MLRGNCSREISALHGAQRALPCDAAVLRGLSLCLSVCHNKSTRWKQLHYFTHPDSVTKFYGFHFRGV